jgi:7-cyano-7-deazaguanine synthase
MSIVTLVSGGLDSTIMALLIQEEGIEQFPLFIDYGQLGRKRELEACVKNFQRYLLPRPVVANLSGYGQLLPSGLTDPGRRIFEDAFLPCRNLLFLLVAGAYAYQKSANATAIGLLNEQYSLFPDQTTSFIKDAEMLLTKSLGRPLAILTPLISFSKGDVVKVARAKGINGTYSCHAGTENPCGVCVACREFKNAEV